MSELRRRLSDKAKMAGRNKKEARMVRGSANVVDDAGLVQADSNALPFAKTTVADKELSKILKAKTKQNQIPSLNKKKANLEKEARKILKSATDPKKLEKDVKTNLKVGQIPSENKDLTKLGKKLRKQRERFLRERYKLDDIKRTYNVDESDLTKYGVGDAKEETRKVLQQKIARNRYNQLGLNIVELAEKAKYNSKSDKWKNANVLANDIYIRTGVDTGSLVNKGYGINNQSTYSREPAIKLMLDIKSTKKAFNLSDDDLYKIITGDKKSNIREVNLLKEKVNRFTDDLYSELNKYYPGQDIGYIKEYLPILRKRMFSEASSDVNIKFDSNNLNPRFINPRIEGDVNSLKSIINEKDPAKLIDYYTNWIERLRVKHNIGKPMERKLLLLEAMGNEGDADKLRKIYMELLGLHRTKQNYNKILGTDITEANFNILKSIAEEADSKGQAVMKSIYDGMYNSYIGLNFRLITAQKFQKWLVGVPELGSKYIYRSNRYLKDSSTKKALKEVESRLYPLEFNYSEIKGSSALGKTGETVKKISNLPSKPLMTLFGKLEKGNRKHIFASAYNKMKELGVTDDVMKTLDQTQRRQVLRAYNKGGVEEASREFGLIMSDRVNFIYNAINRPEVLKDNAVTSKIPFTTWSRGMWSNYYNDLLKGDLKTASKRRIYPLILVYLASMGTDVDFTSYDPSGGLTKIPQIMPMVGTDMKGQFSFGQTAENISPIIKVLRSLSKDNPLKESLRIKDFNK